MTEAETVVLSLLTAAAAAGDPCPSNFDLAFAEGGPGSTGVLTQMLRCMARRRVIYIEWLSARRRVQIVATGRWTGWTLLASRRQRVVNREVLMAGDAIQARRWATEDARAAHVRRWLEAERLSGGRRAFDPAEALDKATIAALSGGTLTSLGQGVVA